MSKRAERRHHRKRLADNRRPLIDPAWPKSDNELASRHPYDCGSRCFLCHWDKLVLGHRRRAQAKRVRDAVIEAYMRGDHYEPPTHPLRYCTALNHIEPLHCPIRNRTYAWHCTVCDHKWLAL